MMTKLDRLYEQLKSEAVLELPISTGSPAAQGVLNGILWTLNKCYHRNDDPEWQFSESVLAEFR